MGIISLPGKEEQKREGEKGSRGDWESGMTK